ncbi:MAG: DEAD/DEAH box helicase, partial [Methanobrevibacter sp.]|nr:DEAD/DEAH box helicase [Methanobrevibacter sp.]
TMIVAPTALGKTLIAILVAAERLKQMKDSKILILAPSKPLTLQHEESFRHFLNVPISSITGTVKVEERKIMWEESQVICATPQTVESDLLNKRYSLENISLIVFDEAHHATGSYSYVYLAGRYIQENKSPLILGLTASPGFEKEKIQTVCENLFIEDIVIKTEEDSDVKPYFNPIEIDWIKVKMSKELEKIKESLDKSLKPRLKGLKSMNVIKSISVGKKEILNARMVVQRRIAHSSNPPKECFNAISIITSVINIQHALELLETQGIHTLVKYLNSLKQKNTKAAKGLLADANFSKAVSLTERAYRNGFEHPKLRVLIEILKEELNITDDKQLKFNKSKNETNENGTNEIEIKQNKVNKSRIIVFTQYRDTLEIIHEKCQKEKINSVEFFGQAAKNGKKGLKQKEQKEIIKDFKNGIYDVLISTSVAEEGIDIPSVDLVILYEPVPSEVRMIQRRGRTGRKTLGKMKVLVTEKTRDEAYYYSSRYRENKMKDYLSKEDLDGIKLKPFENPEIKNDYEKTPNTIYDKINQELEENDKLDLKEQRVVVYADSRESSSKVLKSLDYLKVNIIIKSMTVADYQISQDVAIERKTTKDFIDSIIDKRLFKQAKRMKEEFKKPIMILEGDDLYGGFLSPEAIRGSIASISLDYGISIIPSRNPEDTAALIRRMAIREQKNEKVEITIRTEKKPLNTIDQQHYIVESLPGIGPVNAKKLLENFSSIKNIINADKSQLKEVEGIGDKMADNIINVVESEYKQINRK